MRPRPLGSHQPPRSYYHSWWREKGGLFGLWLLLLVLTASLRAPAQIPPRPNPPRLVNDFARLLSADEVARLEQKLVAYNDSTSTQITIVTVPTLGDYDVADFGQKLGESWGVGGKANNNGILVLVAQQERKLNISTGYGMEERVPDAQARLIIERILKPAFKQQQYYQGLDQTTDEIIRLASGAYKAPLDENDQGSGDGPPFWLIILVVLLILWLISRRGGGNGGRRSGWGSGSGGFFPPIIIGGGGGSSWGGGGDSGGSSGGFGGFGGGSFGGGGASGDW